MACRCARRPRRNPVTPAGYHLRRGMLVLWRDDAGQLLLAHIADALVALGPRGARVPAVRIVLAGGQDLVSTLDRIHELPRHESTARRRGRW